MSIVGPKTLANVRSQLKLADDWDVFFVAGKQIQMVEDDEALDEILDDLAGGGEIPRHVLMDRVCAPVELPDGLIIVGVAKRLGEHIDPGTRRYAIVPVEQHVSE